MDSGNRLIVGWTVFGVVAVICAAAAIIVSVIVGTQGDTERTVACIEAGSQLIEGICING